MWKWHGKLYALVNALTGVPNNVNPLPECYNYEQLADDFEIHFMTKIKKIRDSLDIFPKYNPPMRDTQKLTHFNGPAVEEVHKMVNNMQAKTCDGDPIPTKVLKGNITTYNRTNSRNISNISLTEGEVCNILEGDNY